MSISKLGNNSLPSAVVCGLLLFIAVAGFGCNGWPKVQAEVEQPVITPPKLVREAQGVELLQLQHNSLPDMVLVTINEIDMPGVLETTGQITFDDRRVANIISRVTGRIEQIYVSQWDYVRRGQPIVRLYSPDFMTAEAEYLQARTSAPTLAAGGSGNDEFARSMVDAALRKLELLGIDPQQIAQIKSPVPFFTMRAPISGNVVQNQALRGSAVNPGDILYSLGTLEDVWITGDIYEDDLARVHVGQELQAVTTAYPDEVFHGTIARISPNIDPTTHTLQIRCEVKNPGFKLKPQMLAQVRIAVRPGQALVVPMDALVFETDSYFAYVDTGNDRLERRKVIISSWSQRGYARVVSGLNPGDRIVTGSTMQVNELWHEAHGERS
jgi:membrane fusion protein, copper/silver efflux system